MLKPRTEIRGVWTAPLLYWLAIVCGLTGITVVRLDELDSVVPIWFGAVVGVSLGQLLAVLRVRVWTTAAFLVMSSWILGPAFYVGVCELFGFNDVHTGIVFAALIPAFVCGYASLTERGGLLAFWYPAMLWMLVILDGEAPGTFAPRAYLPMAIGLGVFFVAFLRARETRRVVLWQAYAHDRLAKPGENAAIHGSGARGLSQLAFTTLMGSGAFLLAAWIAPNLFQKDRALHQKLAQVPVLRYESTGSSLPCCPTDTESEKVKEYMPLRHQRETAARARLACTYCPPHVPAEDAGPYGQYRGAGIREMGPTTHYGYDYSYSRSSSDLYAYDGPGATWGNGATSYGNGGYGNGGYGNGGYSNGDYSNGGFTPPTYTPPSYTPPSYTPPSYTPPSYTPPVVEPVVPRVNPVVDPVPPPPKPVAEKKKKPTKIAVAPAPVAPPTPRPAAVPPAPRPVVEPPRPAPAPVPPAVTPTATPTEAPEPSAPWGVLLPLLGAIFLVPLGTRLVRRQVTLRHLAQPFWKETIDQRISNHWQRMLIGLRDAGIQLRATEQPGTFAKRVAIKGMDECATILERVRHGVRVEDEDLASMHRATDEIYGAARKKAGIAGRVAGAFRWPLV